MPLDENVARQKSTRWVKASQANYDGDDWSDDYAEEEEQRPPVPRLPELPELCTAATALPKDDDEYSYGTAPTPDLSIKKFQEIDLDADTSGEEPPPQTSAQEQLPVEDEYARIIQDNEDEDDEYTPQTSSRFQPFPDEEEEDNAEELPALEPVEKDSEGYAPLKPEYEETPVKQEQEEVPYDSNVPTSIFTAFPTEFDEMVPQDTIEVSDEVVQREPDSHSGDIHEEVGDYLTNSPSTAQNRLSAHSIGSQIGRSPVASDINYSDDEDDDAQEYIPKTGYFQSELSADEEQLQEEGLNQDTAQSWRSLIGIDDDSEEDDYAPRTSHFQSQLSDEEPEEEHGDDEHEDDDYDEVPSENLKNLILTDVTPEAKAATTQAVPTIVEPSESPAKEISIDTVKSNAHLEAPPLSPAPYELSDTDTLHIHDPLSSPEAEDHHHLTEPILPETNPADISVTNSNYGDQDLNEHAYLAGLVSTPNPDDFEVRQFEPEVSEEVQPVPETLKPSRESQFYNSMNDYYDDYTDESGANKEELGVTRTHSSGSLSTGGFSIRSETGGYRSSKMSDRTASFTGERTASFTNQSVSDADGAEKESQLNPAMSINFGHWRPNTESFRDQFISGTGDTTAAPPLPKIDNYARNSRGEIIEDNASMAESVAASNVSNGSELKKHMSLTSSGTEDRGEHNSSMLSVLEDDGEFTTGAQSKDLKDGTTYKTDSDSMIPVHIPLNSPNSGNKPSGQYFHEHLASETTVHAEGVTKTISTRKAPSYNMKKIAMIENPQVRIKKYHEARDEEANVSTGLEIWIAQAMDAGEMESYKSPVTSHVKQAYAEASQFSKKHTNINMGSFLNKRKVIQETSSGAHSIAKGAKGIFSMGRRMMKSSEKF